MRSLSEKRSETRKISHNPEVSGSNPHGGAMSTPRYCIPDDQQWSFLIYTCVVFLGYLDEREGAAGI